MTDSFADVISIDHGAQYFTARDLRFMEQVGRWQEEGICFPWSHELTIWSGGALHPEEPQWREVRFACRGGMSHLGKSLAEGLKILLEFQVSEVGFHEGTWELHADASHQASTIRARRLLVSAPIPQSMKLIESHFSADHREFLKRIIFYPCIAVLALYGEEVAPPSWRGIRIRDAGKKLSWIAWDSSRRDSKSRGKVAVLHGSKDFSLRWLDASQEELVLAGRELLGEAATMGGEWLANPREFVVHRWRYALPEGPSAPGGFLRSTLSPSLYLIGDGLNGGRLEGAWLSGLFAAENLLMKRPC